MRKEAEDEGGGRERVRKWEELTSGLSSFLLGQERLRGLELTEQAGQAVHLTGTAANKLLLN